MATPQPLADRAQSDTASVISNNAEGSGELTAVVDDLLNQLNTKFTTISSELLSKMDDMSRRLDNLEATMAGDGTKGSGSGK
ncbi:heat shock factor-binding protein [Pyrenophora tritici-repentis]|uniref:HSBP1 domain containing protein n=2 Tax=Pyrenophora tritici-repentis TaxID=45151 RepID=A0A2W1DJ99_9PLEO|nr:uncharacterized protein PTRG_05967 [Pyrenophora tritici-repentis Pt-1C-BFP]KAA8619092.1 heat shock factor-binding protein [Pyrenophora tritici-repentis]EDU48887.1 hypothetical protein PTRG_05967 [Pyrenophora tritici-repentis Pt-1C-BFP]KAF7449558.1 heat shock factor-binding protein [Pyrenophora tritici-repentis]KAF7570327.1 HSBP1 domain containing protein [Pyrenophora tritici-repentis]KAG9383503.1 heat shock factor-binding protein [Pyrenophora tritici-repentis]